MAFDISTARPVSTGFDISSAKPLSVPERQPEGINRREDVGEIFSRKDIPLGQKLMLAVSPSAQGIRKAQTEVVSPLGSGASTFMFGLPRVAARKFGKEEELFPEQETGGGKTLRFGSEAAGLLGGGAAKVSGLAVKGVQKVGQKFLPEAVGLGVKTIGKVRNRKIATGLLNALEGAVQGAVFGGTQLDIAGSTGIGEEGPTVEGQIKQAQTGAAFGGVLSLAGKGLQKALRDRRKFKVSSTKATQVGKTEKPAVQTLQERAKLAIQNNKQLGAETVKSKVNAIKQSIDEMKIQLEQGVDEGSLKFQEILPGFLRENSKSYGSAVNNISDDLVAKNEQFIVAEVDDFLTKTLNDLDDAGILTGKPRQIIENLKQKYQVKFIGGQQPTSFSVPKSNADQSISFKSIVEDIKTVKKFLSSGAKSGNQKFSQEDMAISFLNRNLGDMLSTRAGGKAFLDLNKEYSNVIKLTKKANQVFKPFKGEFDAKTGAELLKRVAEKSVKGIDDSETRLIRSLEQGTKFAKGSGDLTSGIKDIVQAIQFAKRGIQPVKDSISQQTARNEAILVERLKRLKFTEESIKNLLRDKEKTRRLIRKLEIGVGVVAGGAFAINQLRGLVNSR